MPTYEYQCPKCMTIQEITKWLAELDRDEECPECAGVHMHRIMSPTRSNTSNCQFEAHFNHAFGKVIKSKSNIKDEMLKYKDKTGREVVEVGTDNLSSIKKKRKYEYTLD